MFLYNQIDKCQVEDLLLKTWGMSATSLERHIAKAELSLNQVSNQNNTYLWDYFNGTIVNTGSAATTLSAPMYFGMVSYRIYNDDPVSVPIAGWRVRLTNYYIRQKLASFWALNAELIQQWGDGGVYLGDAWPAQLVTENYAYANTSFGVLNTGIEIDNQTNGAGAMFGAITLEFQGWKIGLS